MKTSLGAKTILLPTPVLVVGTYDSIGKPNIMTAAWGGICCSKPPAINVCMRAATYSYACIIEQKAFTVNIPSKAQAEQADFAGMASGRDMNKFELAGLTPEKSTLVNAPIVKEFPMCVECSLIHTLEIGLHTLFVGEVLDVKVAQECLDASGKLDPAKVDPISFAPEKRAYYGLGELVGKAFSIGSKYLPKTEK